MKAVEAITNLHTDVVERAGEFFGVLGLTEDGMNQGWVARFTSADSGAWVQVVTRDATAPEDSVMTIKVDDVDAAYEEAQRRGTEHRLAAGPADLFATIQDLSCAIMGCSFRDDLQPGHFRQDVSQLATPSQAYGGSIPAAKAKAMAGETLLA